MGNGWPCSPCEVKRELLEGVWTVWQSRNPAARSVTLTNTMGNRTLGVRSSFAPYFGE